MAFESNVRAAQNSNGKHTLDDTGRKGIDVGLFSWRMHTERDLPRTD
jgi:hypothetical protein